MTITPAADSTRTADSSDETGADPALAEGERPYRRGTKLMKNANGNGHSNGHSNGTNGHAPTAVATAPTGAKPFKSVRPKSSGRKWSRRRVRA